MRRWLEQTNGGEKRKEAGDEDIESTSSRETKKITFNAKWLMGWEWLV